LRIKDLGDNKVHVGQYGVTVLRCSYGAQPLSPS